MIKRCKSFIVLKVRDKWIVFFKNKKVSSSFYDKKEAEEYKQFLMSR